MRWINRHPGKGNAALLGALPFALIALAYLGASAARLAANANDKLLPSPGAILETVQRMAFLADPRTGEVLLWADTAASLSRLGLGLGLSALLAVVVGLAIGILPVVRAVLGPLVAFVSMVPPLALLPILFIALGLGEVSKVALIVIGVAPYLIRDLAMAVMAIPREQIVKAETLSASTWLIAWRVVLPQVLPKLLTSLRLQLGPAFLFLIAAEAISAEAGLGYRIFLVRRYLAMDVIFPYVAWITLLAVLGDRLLDWARRRAFPWSDLGET